MHETPQPVDFVKAIAPAVRRAAAIARDLEGRVRNRPKSGESSAVKAALTIADTASQEALLESLFENFPGVCLRAEEDTPAVARFPQQAAASVVIDPIDGTLRCYLEGRGPYAVMIGLAIENEYHAALVALPRESLLLQAARGAGARASTGDDAARPARLGGTGNQVLVSYELPESAADVLRARGFEVVVACGGAISVAPLIPGVRAGIRVATNEARNVSIRGRIGAMISAEAGAVLCSETGEPFPRTLDEPARALLVAADANDLEVLLEAVAAAGIA
jgi:fructose-1,6-bisphosphatase/inositol monophosphatase family enzyme